MATLLEEQATLTRQNQITVPKRVRQILNLRGGQSRIAFIVAKNGTVRVVRAQSPVKQAEDDPELQPFLNMLAKDMREHPQRIKPLRPALLKKARDLVKGVEVDLNGPLIGED
jgi:antitoxin PrlF